MALTGSTIASTYLKLLRANTDTMGADATASYIQDSADTDSALSISTTRVGIGTAAPAVKMHISGTDAADTTYLRIENKPATAATHKSIMEFWGNEGTSDGVSYNIGRIFGEFQGGTAYANIALVLGSASGGGAFNDEITLQNGNVGIGTAAPANALHIVGSNSNTYVFDGYDGDNAGASGITNLTSTAAVLSIIGGNDSTGQDAGLHLRNENTNIDWALYLDLSDSDKFKISRETVDVLDIDSNGKATFAGDVRIEGTQIIQNPASGEHAEITMRAGSGANALLIMEADNSEDNVDTWKLQVADGGIFSLQGTGGGSWANALYFAPTSHDATFAGTVTFADAQNDAFMMRHWNGVLISAMEIGSAAAGGPALTFAESTAQGGAMFAGAQGAAPSGYHALTGFTTQRYMNVQRDYSTTEINWSTSVAGANSWNMSVFMIDDFSISFPTS